mgnify:CR=1 FL=1
MPVVYLEGAANVANQSSIHSLESIRQKYMVPMSIIYKEVVKSMGSNTSKCN